MYLLDANVLITAHNLYYPIESVPEFWSWLVHQAALGNLAIPIEIYEEVKAGGTDEERDRLYGWISSEEVKGVILLASEVEPALVARVIEEGYAPDLTDDELEQIGRDPFLIAHALADVGGRIVVTTENSKPSKLRQNRKIPDVCRGLGVNCCDTFTMLRALQFRTGWQQ